MDERKPLNINACNLEQMRQVLADIDANFAILFAAVKQVLNNEAGPPAVRPT
jgi:hypothetical protein